MIQYNSDNNLVVSPLCVDFNHPELYAQTRPVSCSIYGIVVVFNNQDWSQLLVAITEKLIEYKNIYLDLLEERSLYGNKPYFLANEDGSDDCSLLSNGMWIYTNYNPPTTVTIIKNLCRHCGLRLDNVVIKCSPKYQSNPQTENFLPDQFEIKPTVSDGTESVVQKILEERFPNGIRPYSIIDRNKLKNYYNEITGVNLDVEIDSLLTSIGIFHGEKVFPVPINGKKVLADLLNVLLSEGHRLFYYDEFYTIHSDLLQNVNIFSAELLRTVLLETSPSLWYFKNCFQVDRNTTIESEILRCYETAVSLSCDQLTDMLPYVPLANIRQVLAQNSDFIWVSTGIYTHIHKIEFDTSESSKICSKIKKAVSIHGFASLASFDVSASLELNPELSEIAVKTSLFQLYLSNHYDKHGNIITMKGTTLNTVAILEGFCRSHYRLTLDQLHAYEKEVDGSVNSRSLLAAHNTMVRVDKDIFVGNNKVNFDIEATDNALSLYVHGDVIPLQAVTSFTSFPYIDGYPWNLYLLESYCKHFSKQFMYQCLSVNSRNVGAIFRKSAGFNDYIDVLAAAVAASNIELNEKMVGDFLFENRYIAQRTGSISKVTKKAQFFRKGKV